MSEWMSDGEFYKLCARRLDCTPATARKYMEGLVETIVYELYINQYCRVPNLGTFTTKHIDAYEQKQKAEDGIVTYKVPAHEKPVFIPSDNFINDINASGVTKAYRKRLKNKALTKADLERIARAEQYEIIKRVSIEDKEKSKNDFLKFLEEKINNHEREKVDGTK